MKKFLSLVPGAHRTRRGFTLIELLVVIAIIAILAAILFPVFAKAREKARQTACLSNMKQLGLGFYQYIGDYDQLYPVGNHPQLNGNGVLYSNGCGWAGQIYSNVKSTGIFACPDDATTATAPAVPISYNYNHNLAVLHTATNNYITGVAEGSLNQPSRTIMLCEVKGATADVTNGKEVGSSSSDGGDATATSYMDPTATLFTTGHLGISTTRPAGLGGTGRHSDGSNFLCADGHAKWQIGGQVSNGISAALSTDAENTTRAAGTNYTGFHGLTFGTI